ncbi:DUF1684 domain-containing protein [Mangrovivirga cuniculi]|uniref:DUF1684 domain-containing protein n=1 Tax=Mangrovivirga cuniculi TaxID=2715131 RepID=A0A4D7JGA6_9BACT|nr:DUF1684 domain-containing protein [Mangrovivirga cuniculi]QCK13717.1 hypothetical protein DCC35_02580 [Mangrovivirga cuniculi]
MKYPFFYLILFCLCLSTSFGQNYEQEILEHRISKDSSFLTDEDSPVEEKNSFKGLNYFSVDPSFKVSGELVKFPGLKMKTFETSSGIQKTYKLYGKLTFTLKGEKFSLPVYQSMIALNGYKDYLFVPFMDQTTGLESYAAGRYLDFSIPEDFDNVIVDFNYSYNPYCAYSEGYSCPIPGKESYLDIEITAGEKDYKDSI